MVSANLCYWGDTMAIPKVFCGFTPNSSPLATVTASNSLLSLHEKTQSRGGVNY
jgi:hypothetical protein